MNRSLMVGAFALVATMSLALAGCPPGSEPKVESAVGPVLEAGCTLVGVLAPDGSSAAAICKTVAPVLTPFIQELIAALGKQPKGDAEPTYVQLVRNGKSVGVVRSDIAAAVQAKLDSTK